MDSSRTSSEMDRNKAYKIYPYSSLELSVMFFYGDDFLRRRNISFIPKSIRIIGITFFFIIVSAAIILHMIRKRIRNRRCDVISIIIDTIVIFIAGGNLRMHHKFERLFFGICLIGALFITSLWCGDLLDYIYQTMDQRISTFEQLAEINAPIYIAPSFFSHKSEIYGMLRC